MTLENVIQMYEKTDVVVVSLFPDLKEVSGYMNVCVYTSSCTCVHSCTVHKSN